MDAKVFSYGVRSLVARIFDKAGLVKGFRQCILSRDGGTLAIVYADREKDIVTIAVSGRPLTLQVIDGRNGKEMFTFPNTFNT